MKTSRTLNPTAIASACVASACLAFSAAQGDGPKIGLFQGHNDVGTVLHPGAAEYDTASETYTLTGSGENIWSTKDDFQFVWRKMSNENVSLSADISLLGTVGDNHRKAVLMIRQSLDPDSAYADVARHGDGLTSLQFRDAAGGTTHEIESNMSAPPRLRMDKRGDQFYMWIGDDQHMQFAGGSIRVPLKAPFYVGIGVCAHNKDAVQRAAFSNIGLTSTESRPGQTPDTFSTLETITVASTDARVSYVAQHHLENPSWSPDGTSLLFHSGSTTEQVPYKGGTPQPAAAGSDDNLPVPDDVAGTQARVSPDGKQIAFLASSRNVQGEVLLSVRSVADGSTRVLAKLQGGPGSLGAHPWSPDNKRLAFISYQSLK